LFLELKQISSTVSSPKHPARDVDGQIEMFINHKTSGGGGGGGGGCTVIIIKIAAKKLGSIFVSKFLRLVVAAEFQTVVVISM
jgi:hypothetical protein